MDCVDGNRDQVIAGDDSTDVSDDLDWKKSVGVLGWMGSMSRTASADHERNEVAASRLD